MGSHREKNMMPHFYLSIFSVLSFSSLSSLFSFFLSHSLTHSLTLFSPPLSPHLDTPRWLPFVSLDSNAQLSDAMGLLGRERFHRVLIAESGTGNITNIVTQSAVVKVGRERGRGREGGRRKGSGRGEERGSPLHNQ